MCLNPSALFVNSIKHPALQTISSASFRNERDITCQELEDEYRNAKPLTAVYEDAQGRIIQLWKTHAYGLVGSVVDSDGHLTVIPGENIRNPLNNKQSPNELFDCLEKALRNWDITYDIQMLTLTIWPHLEAAGRCPHLPQWTAQTRSEPPLAADYI